MRKVFIPQLPTRFDKATGQRIPSIDTNPASEFGKIIIMFDTSVSKENAIKGAPTACAAISAEDYILAAGDIALLARVVACTIRRFGSAIILRWDNDAKIYIPEEIKE